GVALGARPCMHYGLTWLGIELEQKFVTLGRQNLTYWRERYGLTGARLVQGDSRHLQAILAGAPDAAAIVASPPYAGTGEGLGTHNGIDWTKAKEGGKICTPAREASGLTYGTAPGQLGALPPGDVEAIVSSPPYEGSVHNGNGIDPSKLTGNRPGPNTQAGAEGYGIFTHQLGNTTGDTCWSAAPTILAQCAALLPAGAVAVWIVKPFVRDKKIVPFDAQWQALCEHHGFRLVERIECSLVEHHGTQETL